MKGSCIFGSIPEGPSCIFGRMPEGPYQLRWLRSHPRGSQEGTQRHPEAPRAPQRLQEVLEAIIDTTLNWKAKVLLKCQLYKLFLKVRLRFIYIYKQNCSHTARTWRGTLQGPLYNTVRTPTAEDCLGTQATLMHPRPAAVPSSTNNARHNLQ